MTVALSAALPPSEAVRELAGLGVTPAFKRFSVRGRL